VQNALVAVVAPVPPIVPTIVVPTAPAFIPPIAIVAVAPVACPLEVVARVARRVAVAAEAFDHTIEVPFGVANTIVTVFPTLGLGRYAAHHRTSYQQKRHNSCAPKKRFYFHDPILPS